MFERKMAVIVMADFRRHGCSKVILAEAIVSDFSYSLSMVCFRRKYV